MVMTERPKVYSVPAGRALADAVAAGVLRSAALDPLALDPLALADVTVLVPTRRAVRAMQDAFLRTSGGRATLLPAMRAIGDVDEDAVDFGGGEPALLAAVPPAIPPLRRRMLLAELVRAFDKNLLPEQAVMLAAELARLIDDIETERLDRDRLNTIVPDRYASHWQTSLAFLRIVTQSWPAILAEDGAIDPATRRNLLLDAQGKLWRHAPPQGPVIAAGSTGTIPASADLLACISRLPKGAVVLPGLDRQMAATAWAILDPTHPQYAMKRLLERIGIERADVADWPDPDGGRVERARLVAEAMLPAAATASWRGLAKPAPAALDGVMRIDCRDHQDEAEVIALLMRQALEVPDRRAALVTPDRALARRVAAELLRWRIVIDDSAGTPLGQTPPGAFFRLVATMAAEAFAPVPLLAVLKHPLAAGGESPGAFRVAVRRFEQALLRGPRPAPHLAGLARAVHAFGQRNPESSDIADWFARFARLCRPFAALHENRRAVPFRTLLAAHVEVAERLAANDPDINGGDTGAPSRLWAGEAGTALLDFVTELDQAAIRIDPIDPSAWAALIDSLMAERVVRPKRDRHPRLMIWGPLEARLQQPDLLILGGLNEGTWPPEPGPDPWMSRAMRAEFGLAPRERRIGLSAHDFAQAFCAPEVVLTRAARVEGAPSVPARWLLRFDAMLKRHDIVLAERGRAWRAAHAGQPVPVRPQPRPQPAPPVRLRPRELSVTEIETLIRNPYAIYARHVLKLRALDPIDADPDAAEHGSMIHKALDDFVRAYPDALPDDATHQLIACGKKAFGAVLDRPLVQAFWWPRFLRIADWFMAEEVKRRTGFMPLASECPGAIAIAAAAGPFRIKAKADRIDRRLADGSLEILDYKTGRVPSAVEIKDGRAPQLVLEAWIAQDGGFAERGIGPASVGGLVHVILKGGDPAGEIRPVAGDIAPLVDIARQGLVRLIDAYDSPQMPYHVWPATGQGPAYDDYRDLERVAEWAGLRDGDS
ncbi:MAG: double-strand break repair protein AddB [Alphaproteobacteria bacterium]